LEIRGYLDSVADGYVAGWVFDPDNAGVPVSVAIHVNGRRILTTRADEYRPDLASARIGDGHHGFGVRLPKFVAIPGVEISVLALPDETPLPNSPKTLTDGNNDPLLSPQKLVLPPDESAGVDKLADMQRRMMNAFSAWGISAFELLPDYVAAAMESADSTSEVRLPGTRFDSAIRQIFQTHPSLQLPFLAEPAASIIIPAFNKFGITYQCIRSIIETEAAELGEVILADDCSADATAVAAGLIENLRVSRNPENLGFLRNCNRAARMARGRILVFLNNDCIVRPGWLKWLLDTYVGVPEAGIVGSKLLFENGKLQEAGGMLWANGSAWNYGRNDDPGRPEYSYLRQSDYVSGASLSIPRQLFQALGGFDEHYAPAYCEDVDLCLRVWRAGHKVLYQPMSETVHLEGRSHGNDERRGLKAYQVTNTKKLFERWRDQIAKNGANGERALVNKDRHHLARAFVIDAVTPEPDRDAGSIATLEQMRILQDLGYKVTFIPEDNLAHMGEPTRRLQAIGIECIYAPYVQSVHEWLEKLGDTVDVIHVYRHNVLQKYLKMIREMAPQAKLIYTNADMHHLRMLRQAETTGDKKLKREAEKIREIELNLHRNVDCSHVHSDFEMKLLAKATPKAMVRVIRWITEVEERAPEREGRDSIVFLGGYQHPPNVDAVEHFIADILPTVVRAVPEVKFLICGSKMPERFKEFAGPNVEAVGFVPDLAPLFRRCLATVAPLRFGAGFKGKIATSLAYGVPSIVSQIAVEGTGLDGRDGVILAETPEAYAKAVRTLYRSEKSWRTLSSQAIAAVDRNFSRAAARDLWIEMLKSVGAPVAG